LVFLEVRSLEKKRKGKDCVVRRIRHGAGSLGYFATELFGKEASTKLVHVP
jgi:hypothetical protein